MIPINFQLYNSGNVLICLQYEKPSTKVQKIVQNTFQNSFQKSVQKSTVFPWIVSVETIFFWKWKMWKFSYSFRIMAIFYFINWIVAAETIEGGKLFKGGNYLRKYGTSTKISFTCCRTRSWVTFLKKSWYYYWCFQDTHKIQSYFCQYLLLAVAKTGFILLVWTLYLF